MTGAKRSKSEMKKKKDEKPEEISAAEENAKSELELPIWSVVTFDEVAGKNLTYAKAAKKLEKLKAEKVSGLCIITDEAAARLTAAKNNK